MNTKLTHFGFYLVAFADLLGQKSVLSDFDKRMSPGNEILESELIEKIQTSFGVVEKFKEGFKSFFDQFLKVNKNTGLPDEAQKVFENIRKSNLKFQRFSDSVILYFPLFDKDFPVPTNSIYAVLCSLAVQSILNLSQKHPIRGGVDIGFGGEVDEHFYGPGLFRAYHLESDIANYPRIVVGNRLIEYLYEFQKKSFANFYEQINDKMAKDCLRLIEKDSKGVSYIDLFSPSLVKMSRDIGHIGIYNEAQNFVQKCLEDFKNNPKLLAKYEPLEKYFKKNMKILEKI